MVILTLDPYSAGIDFSRQNMTSTDVRFWRLFKVDPRTVRVKIFLMVIDPYHRYSNESERSSEDIYDDFKLKKKLCSRCVLQIISAL